MGNEIFLYIAIFIGGGMWLIGKIAEISDNRKAGKSWGDSITTEYSPRKNPKYAGTVGPVEASGIAFTVQGHRANNGRFVRATLEKPDGGSDDYLEYVSADYLARNRGKAAAAGVIVEFTPKDVEKKYAHFKP